MRRAEQPLASGDQVRHGNASLQSSWRPLPNGGSSNLAQRANTVLCCLGIISSSASASPTFKSSSSFCTVSMMDDTMSLRGRRLGYLASFHANRCSWAGAGRGCSVQSS